MFFLPARHACLDLLFQRRFRAKPQAIGQTYHLVRQFGKLGLLAGLTAPIAKHCSDVRDAHTCDRL
jgi:hypothetical protein